jgi:hypothetical protein
MHSSRLALGGALSALISFAPSFTVPGAFFFAPAVLFGVLLATYLANWHDEVSLGQSIAVIAGALVSYWFALSIVGVSEIWSLARFGESEDAMITFARFFAASAIGSAGVAAMYCPLLKIPAGRKRIYLEMVACALVGGVIGGLGGVIGSEQRSAWVIPQAWSILIWQAGMGAVLGVVADFRTSDGSIAPAPVGAPPD